MPQEIAISMKANPPEIDNDLWRTMSEPDIDPRLADGLRENPDFAKWWVQQVLPSVELDELLEIKPNLTREKDSWSAQSRAGRETDLHVVVKDRSCDRYAILTESKVVAPAGHRQPEDYAAYARWGESKGKWTRAVTALMAPEGYLARQRSADQYEVTLSYERIHDAARSNALDDLADYLRAGITRYQQVGGAPRNPDDLIGGFRVQYADLLRDENRELYNCLRGKDRKQFDGSQRWFYFCPKQPLLGKSGVRIIHQICNSKKGEQNRSRLQTLSIQVPRIDHGQDSPPHWGARHEWCPSAKYWIRNIAIDPAGKLFFDSFDGDAARRVWAQISELIENDLGGARESAHIT